MAAKVRVRGLNEKIVGLFEIHQTIQIILYRSQHHDAIMTMTSQSSSTNCNLTTLLPTILSSNALQYQIETPATASTLFSQNQLNPSQFLEFSPDIERTLITSFIEDDYDGKLHFLTLNTTTSDNNAQREVIGIAFWREIDSEEMNEWMDLHRVKDTLRRHCEDEIQSSPTTKDSSTHKRRGRLSFQCQSDNQLSQHAKRKMEMIRSDSITWIRNALHSQENHSSNEATSTNSTRTDPTIRDVNNLLHAWIKIELIAIHKSHRHHHYGPILLACLLSMAYKTHETHAILHVAGSTSNTAALKLYERFGFVNLPRHEKGGPFEKPDGDLFVLGDIGGVLERCPWEEMQLS